MSKKNKIEPMTNGMEFNTFYTDIKSLIVEARTKVAKQVNQVLTLTYWQIGKLIETKILNSGKAEYGDATIKKLSQKLSKEFGKGFNYSSLTRMRKLYRFFPDSQIVATLSQQLSWSHFVEIIKFDNDIQREFYAKMCSNEGWSVRTLRERINSMLFERTAIAKKPDEVIRKGKIEI